jgi:hypothetical protein
MFLLELAHRIPGCCAEALAVFLGSSNFQPSVPTRADRINYSLSK